METRGAGTSESNFESVQPKVIPELVDLQKVSLFFSKTELIFFNSWLLIY
jgi:hypothetical protein